MPVAEMQQQLQTLYDIQIEVCVEDYLVTNRQQVNELSRKQLRDTPEHLLIQQSEGELHISLFVEKSLLDELVRDNPYQNLNANNMPAFCVALEGVSHFLYTVYNATHDRPISQLELELQAEVDKFISLMQLADSQSRAFDWPALAVWLFDDCRFDDSLKQEEYHRYEMANRLAARFCRALAKRQSRHRHLGTVLAELRRFYRKRHLDKLSCAMSGLQPSAP